MIATTRMFGKPITEEHELKEAVATYITRAAEKLRRQHSVAGTIDIFVVSKPRIASYTEYRRESDARQVTLPVPTANTRTMIGYTMPLVADLFQQGTYYIKAGVILSDIVPDESIQGNLFYESAHPADKKLFKANTQLENASGTPE
jgi:DNA polymerase V